MYFKNYGNQVAFLGKIVEKDPERLLFRQIEDPIEEMIMSSPGGSLATAYNLGNIIANYGIQRIFAGRRINSAAVLPYLRAKERVALESTEFLFHFPTVKGHISDREWKQHVSGAAAEIAEHSGMSQGEVIGLMHGGQSISAYLAQELGIVHKVVTSY